MSASISYNAGEGAASIESDFLGSTMLWSSFRRDKTAELLAASGLTLVSDELKLVTQTDEVDEEGMGFRFYTCKK